MARGNKAKSGDWEPLRAWGGGEMKSMWGRGFGGKELEAVMGNEERESRHRRATERMACVGGNKGWAQRQAIEGGGGLEWAGERRGDVAVEGGVSYVAGRTEEAQPRALATPELHSRGTVAASHEK